MLLSVKFGEWKFVNKLKNILFCENFFREDKQNNCQGPGQGLQW